MRLVVLSAAYPSPAEPERAIFVENLTRALAARLARRSGKTGDVTVVAPRVHSGDPVHEERAGLCVSRFGYCGGGRRLKEIRSPSLLVLASYFFSGALAAWRSVRRLRPTVLLAHWVLPCGPIAALVALVARIPLVLVAHGSDVHVYGSSSPLRRRLSCWALKRARGVVAVSGALVEELRDRFGVPSEKITLLPMGVDDLWFTSAESDARADARRTLEIGAEERLLLFVGDVTHEKGIEDLLDAVSKLEGADGPRGSDGAVSWRLVVIGDGDLRHRLAAPRGRPSSTPGPGKIPDSAPSSIGPCAHSRVEALGRLSPAQLAVWYHAADLLVLPSHGEGTPVSILEALACSLPVVASRVGGIPDVVDDGQVGRLVPPRDPGALADVLRDLLASPEKLAALRSGAESARVPTAREQAARLTFLLEEVTRDG